MNNRRILSVICWISLLCSCGPGVSDSELDITDTGLTYIDYNPASRSIVRKKTDDSFEHVVNASVLAYRHNKGFVVGARQLVNHYLCEGPMSGLEVLDTVEYFIIQPVGESGEHRVILHLEFNDFKENAELTGFSEEVIDEIKPGNISHFKIVSKSLGDCENPKLIR